MSATPERRKGAPSASSPLPSDFLKMVVEVFTTNFDEGLKAIAPLMQGKPGFAAGGAVYSDELVLYVTLLEEGEISATTVHASADFDPKASAPTIQDLLAILVDGAGVIYGHLLSASSPERLEQVASHALSALDNVPFHWSEMKVEGKRIHVKVDKSNPILESAANQWLRKNDPELKDLNEQNEAESKALFVTGESAKKSTGRGSTSGGLH